MLDVLLAGGDTFNPIEILFDQFDIWHGKGQHLLLDLNAMIGAGKWVDDKTFQFIEGKEWLRITKHTVYLFIATITVLVVMLLASRSRGAEGTSAPRGLRNFIEPVLLFIRDGIVYPNIKDPHHHDDHHGEGHGNDHGHGHDHKPTHKLADKFLPFFVTLFLFLAMINLLGLFPGSSTPTGALAFTGTLATVILLTYVIGGMILQKPFIIGFWKNLVPKCPIFLWPILFVLEVVGAIAKPFALAVRLFANMTAGHCLLLSLAFLGALAHASLGGAGIAIGAVSTIGSVAIYGLELFVALLQAYIFTYLSAIFIGMYLVPEH